VAPVASTLNVAPVPATTLTGEGWVTITGGGAAPTVSVALACAEPIALLTITVYTPASAAPTFRRAYK
jgi:hypothetical protein